METFYRDKFEKVEERSQRLRNWRIMMQYSYPR
jgi:hypothetical protein